VMKLAESVFHPDPRLLDPGELRPKLTGLFLNGDLTLISLLYFKFGLVLLQQLDEVVHRLLRLLLRSVPLIRNGLPIKGISDSKIICEPSLSEAVLDVKGIHLLLYQFNLILSLPLAESVRRRLLQDVDSLLVYVALVVHLEILDLVRK